MIGRKFKLERNQTLLFIVLVVTSLSLMAWNLGGGSLSHDEGWTYLLVSWDWENMMDAVRIDGVHPPLFYIFVKLLGSIIGWSEAALRSVSLLSGIGALILAWKLGNLVGGKAGGLAAVWFVGFHPMVLYYARLARQYGLVHLLALGSVFFFLKAVESDDFWDWVLTGILVTLGSLTHFFFLILGAFMILFSIVDIKIKPVNFRKTFIVWGISILPLIGWIIWFFSQDDPSIAITWIIQPDTSSLLHTAWMMLGGVLGNGWVNIVYSGFSLGLVVFGLMDLRYRKKTTIVFLGGLAIPILGIWLISQIRPIYVDRYFIVLLPFIMILVAIGANHLFDRIKNKIAEPEKLQYFLGVGLLITGLISGVQIHVKGNYQTEDWRGMTIYWEERWNGEDVIWVEDGGALAPMSFYFEGDIFDIDLVYEIEDCTSHCWRLIQGDFDNDEIRIWELNDCQVMDEWISSPGLAIWKLNCGNIN